MKVRQNQRGEQRSYKSLVPVPVRVSEVVEDVANPNPSIFSGKSNFTGFILLPDPLPTRGTNAHRFWLLLFRGELKHRLRRRYIGT